MHGRCLVGVACLVLAAWPVAAQRPLVPDAEIDQAIERRGPLIVGVVAEDIPAGLPRERRAGTAGIGVRFVPRGPNPLSFYSDPESRQVIVPMESVLFIDDLATVLSWFDARGCRREPTQTYLWALLRDHADLPRPLEAFAIDRGTALADPAVNDTSTKLYNGILLFLLAHEVGHLVLGHVAGLTGEASQTQEIAADGFALDYFEAVGMPPIDIMEYLVAARWLDPVGEAVAVGSHPVTAERLRAIAERMKADPDAFSKAFVDDVRGKMLAREAAQNLGAVADLLADEMMVTVAPLGLAREFPLSRLASACPS